MNRAQKDLEAYSYELHLTQLGIKCALQGINNLVSNNREKLESMATTTGGKEKTFMVRVVRDNEVTRGPVKTN